MPFTGERKRAYYREWDRKRRERIDALKDVPCADCGVKYPRYVMQFDHLRDKSLGVSKMRSYRFDRILDEVAKCEVVCANCHAERTFKRRQRR